MLRSRVSVPRPRPIVIEAHRQPRAGSTGGSSPCSPGQAARLRVAPVPRPSGRAVDPALGCRSSRPYDGARPGNRHLTRTGPVRNAVLRTAFSQQASKNSGVLPRIRWEGETVNSNNGHTVTIKSAEISRNIVHYLHLLLLGLAGCGITNARLMTTAAGRPRRSGTPDGG